MALSFTVPIQLKKKNIPIVFIRFRDIYFIDILMRNSLKSLHLLIKFKLTMISILHVITYILGKFYSLKLVMMFLWQHSLKV